MRHDFRHIFFAIFLSLLALGFSSTSMAAVLDGFEIKTADDGSNVRVILYTHDGRANYRTVSGAKGFNLVLEDTKLSAENLKNGLPVVIDNQNKFIGRAVPGSNGTVNILIPNLPTENYSVSVQQKNNTSASPKSNGSKALATSLQGKDSTFENIAKQYQAESHQQSTQSETSANTQKLPKMIGMPRQSKSSAQRPSANPSASQKSPRALPRRYSQSPATSRTIQPVPPTYVAPGYGVYPQYGPPFSPQFGPAASAQTAVAPGHFFPQWQPERSVIETTPSASQTNTHRTRNTVSVSDNELAEDSLGGMPIDTTLIESRQDNMPAPDIAPASGGIFSGISGFFNHWVMAPLSKVPLWILILGGLLLSGIGLIALIVAFAMARIVFASRPVTTARTAEHVHYKTAPSPRQAAYQGDEQDRLEGPDFDESEIAATTERYSPSSSYVTSQGRKPIIQDTPQSNSSIEDEEFYRFEDSAQIEGDDYLMGSAANLDEAVGQVGRSTRLMHTRQTYQTQQNTSSDTSKVSAKPYASRPNLRVV